MLKSKSPFNDREKSISYQNKEDFIIDDMQMNSKRPTNAFEQISDFITLQNQNEKDLFPQNFSSVDLNRDQISKAICPKLIGKKRRLTDSPIKDSKIREINIFSENSIKNTSNRPAATFKNNFININKNFKNEKIICKETQIGRNFELNDLHKITYIGNKKTFPNGLNGESKITDFFKEKKKNINFINKQIEFKSNEEKFGNLHDKCLINSRNLLEETTITSPFKFGLKKSNNYQKEKLKNFDSDLKNKVHNKNLNELYNLNKKTTMEDINNDNLLLKIENTDLKNFGELLHDKLIFTGKNNLNYNYNNLNCEEIKNNKNQTNFKINNYNNELSALNSENINEKTSIEKSLPIENRDSNPNLERDPLIKNQSKNLDQLNNETTLNNNCNISEKFCNEKKITIADRFLNTNLYLKENEDYNNINERRVNTDSDNLFYLSKENELNYKRDHNSNKINEKYLGFVEKTFSNLELKEAQNLVTTKKNDDNVNTYQFKGSTCMVDDSINNLEEKYLDSKSDIQVVYDKNITITENFRIEKPYHKYFLRSNRHINHINVKPKEHIKTKRIRKSLSKKKKINKPNCIRKSDIKEENVNDNRYILQYFKQEKIKDKFQNDKELCSDNKELNKNSLGSRSINNDENNINSPESKGFFFNSIKENKGFSLISNLSTNNNLIVNKENQSIKKISAIPASKSNL